MVMMTVDTPTTVERGKGRNVSWSASRFAKLWEAEAEVRKPDRVTPIWMVERKRLEFSVSFTSFWAFLLPSSAIFFSLPSFKVMTAISEAAKKPLTRMSTSSRITEKIASCAVMESAAF